MPFTNHKLFILTGEVHTGKSTALERFVLQMEAHAKTVKGLLNPSINDEKHFVNLANKEEFSANKVAQSDLGIKVGKYEFSTNAFKRAQEIISEETVDHCDLFIIDELGKLEMKGEGLEPAISNFLKRLPKTKINQVIIVVRDYLVKDVKSSFHLESAKLITKEDLEITNWV